MQTLPTHFHHLITFFFQLQKVFLKAYYDFLARKMLLVILTQTVALYAANATYSVFNSFSDKMDCRLKIQQTTCKFCK